MDNKPFKPKPSSWWQHLMSQTNQSTIPPRPNPLARLSLKVRYVFSGAKEELKLAVWRKALKVPEYDPAVIRRDIYGSLMAFSHHGDCDSSIGWQIDHIHPRAKGGSDELSNLQPLNWRNNQHKHDNVIMPPPTLRRR